MKLNAGTSGFAYKEWKGKFYPEGLPDSEMLPYYAANFHTVEVNNTFYRLPGEKVLAQWAEQVPANFTFALKASRLITHQKRLKDAADPLGFLLRNVRVMEDKLGPVLFQLPPNLKKDVARLQAFLELLPPDLRAAFEFRHASWLDDEVFDTLRARHAALCIAQTEEEETPLVPTADWGYLRLRRVQYEEPDLRDWATRIQAQPWREAYVYFKHEEEGTGPELARRFLALETAL